MKTEEEIREAFERMEEKYHNASAIGVPLQPYSAGVWQALGWVLDELADDPTED